MSRPLSPLLAIETSAPCASVALRLPSGSIITRECPAPQSHNEELAALVSDILSEGKVPASELKGIVIGRGPGSFTGLRIGYSFVQGLSLAHQLPVTELCSFEAAAFGSVKSDGSVVICICADARRDELFFGLFDGANNTAIEIVAAASLEGRIAAFANGRPVEIVSLCGALPQFSQLHPTPAAPYSIAKGLLRLANGAMFIEGAPQLLSQMEPAYLRTVSARTILERTSAERTAAGGGK